MANKYNVSPTDPRATTQAFLGDPRPAYVPLADVAFGAPNIVMPHSLPDPSQLFPAPTFNKMQIPVPAIGTILDERRNGVTF